MAELDMSPSEMVALTIAALVVLGLFIFVVLGPPPDCCGRPMRRISSGDSSLHQCDKCKRIQ